MLKTTKLITRQQVSKNDFELEQNLKYAVGSADTHFWISYVKTQTVFIKK